MGKVEGPLYQKYFKDRVCFKDEDEIDGIPIGPVWIDGVKQDEWMFKPDAIRLASEKNLPFETV